MTFIYEEINNSHICQCEDRPKLYIEAVKLKQKKQEQHANGRPLSTGKTDKLCVFACVSEAVGMEGLLCERNQWGRGLYVCV